MTRILKWLFVVGLIVGLSLWSLPVHAQQSVLIGITASQNAGILSAQSTGTTNNCSPGTNGTGCVVLATGGWSAIGLEASGTWTGTITPECTMEPYLLATATWVGLNMVSTTGSTTVTSATANGAWQASIIGCTAVRVRMSAAPTGSALVTIRATMGGGAGSAGGGGGPTADVNVITLAGTAIDTNSGVKSGGTQRMVIATDQPALTNALKVDGSAVTQPVSGTFWQATQPVSGTITANAGSGNFTVVQATGTSLHAVLDTTSTTAVTQATASNLNAAVVGTKTNNNASPGATNIGVLPCIANAAAPSWTEGNLVNCRTNLVGAQAVMITDPTTGAGVSASIQGQQDVAITLANITGGFNLLYASSTVPPFTVTTTRPAVHWGDLNGRAHITGDASMSPLLATATVASGGIASGAIASGAVASGAFASGSIASGALASGSVASGAFAAGSLDSAIVDPCFTKAATPVPINISTATTTVLVAASASNKLYVCSMVLLTAAANNVALVEDASGSCASPDAGLSGGTTSGAGWNFAANSGEFGWGNGKGTVAKTASTNVNVCLITSAATQLSGTLMYVLAP